MARQKHVDQHAVPAVQVPNAFQSGCSHKQCDPDSIDSNIPMTSAIAVYTRLYRLYMAIPHNLIAYKLHLLEFHLYGSRPRESWGDFLKQLRLGLPAVLQAPFGILAAL